MRYKSVNKMTNAEFGAHVQTVARGLAAHHYLHQHPEASQETAFAYSDRVWESYVEKALDFLAVQAAVDEKELLNN